MGVMWLVQLILNFVLTASVVYLIWEQKRKTQESVHQVPWEPSVAALEEQVQRLRERWERELRKLKDLTAKATEILEKIQERKRLPSLEEKELASLTRAPQPEPTDDRRKDLKSLLQEHLA